MLTGDPRGSFGYCSTPALRSRRGLRGEAPVPGQRFPRDPGHPGLFEQAGVRPPDERVARRYHAAWEVGELTDLVRARRRLLEARALVGASDHGTSLSLYAKDPDGLEFEVFWTVPDGTPAGTRPLHLEAELARHPAPGLTHLRRAPLPDHGVLASGRLRCQRSPAHRRLRGQHHLRSLR